MLLVVFGAGASYDSAERLRPDRNHPERDQGRPPLADQLFSDRADLCEHLSHYPQVLPLATRLGAASADRNLEAMLAQFQEEALLYSNRHSELAAVRYYLQIVLWSCTHTWLRARSGVTNYLALLDRVLSWQSRESKAALYCTFNYDTLFEYAASYYLSNGEMPFQNAYSQISDYVGDTRFPLVKLHGSIDWGFAVESELQSVTGPPQGVWRVAHEIIRRFGEVKLGAEIHKVSDRPPPLVDGRAFVPALAIPTTNKNGFVCPPEHVAYLAARLPRVTRLLVVGWRAMETTFVAMMQAHLPQSAQVLVACGEEEDGKATLRRLEAAGVGGEGLVFTGGFSDLVLSDVLDAFLAEPRPTPRRLGAG
jgi:hypothetical protein